MQLSGIFSPSCGSRELPCLSGLAGVLGKLKLPRHTPAQIYRRPQEPMAGLAFFSKTSSASTVCPAQLAKRDKSG